MKALTVQQPWAWAIVHGGKDIENRTQAWSYRGPLAIHAGAPVLRTTGEIETMVPEHVRRTDEGYWITQGTYKALRSLEARGLVRCWPRMPYERSRRWSVRTDPKARDREMRKLIDATMGGAA